jgi:DNA-binding transcriptional ArsR family regulator
MDMPIAVAALAALAHEGRLAAFRLLVKAGPDGMAAGEIARKTNTAPNTMSAQLLVLANARLVHARREGRSIIYAVDFDRMAGLLQFLAKDCCNGRPEICAPLAATVKNCCPPAKARRRA